MSFDLNHVAQAVFVIMVMLLVLWCLHNVIFAGLYLVLRSSTMAVCGCGKSPFEFCIYLYCFCFSCRKYDNDSDEVTFFGEFPNICDCLNFATPSVLRNRSVTPTTGRDVAATLNELEAQVRRLTQAQQNIQPTNNTQANTDTSNPLIAALQQLLTNQNTSSVPTNVQMVPSVLRIGRRNGTRVAPTNSSDNNTLGDSNV